MDNLVVRVILIDDKTGKVINKADPKDYFELNKRETIFLGGGHAVGNIRFCRNLNGNLTFALQLNPSVEGLLIHPKCTYVACILMDGKNIVRAQLGFTPYYGNQGLEEYLEAFEEQGVPHIMQKQSQMFLMWNTGSGYRLVGTENAEEYKLSTESKSGPTGKFCQVEDIIGFQSFDHTDFASEDATVFTASWRTDVANEQIDNVPHSPVYDRIGSLVGYYTEDKTIQLVRNRIETKLSPIVYFDGEKLRTGFEPAFLSNLINENGEVDIISAMTRIRIDNKFERAFLLWTMFKYVRDAGAEFGEGNLTEVDYEVCVGKGPMTYRLGIQDGRFIGIDGHGNVTPMDMRMVDYVGMYEADSFAFNCWTDAEVDADNITVKHHDTYVRDYFNKWTQSGESIDERSSTTDSTGGERHGSEHI